MTKAPNKTAPNSRVTVGNAVFANDAPLALIALDRVAKGVT